MTVLRSLAASASSSGEVTPPELGVYAYASDISRNLILNTDITIDNTTDFKFSFEVKEVVGNDPSGLFTFLGSGSTAGIILRKSDGLFLFRVIGNSNLVRAEGYYTIDNSSYIRYEFAYESTTDTFTISANDSVIYTSVQNGVSFSLTDNRLFVHGTAKLFVKEVKLEKNGVVTNHWYNTTGTGDVLTDHVGGNHATLSLPATSDTWADASGRPYVFTMPLGVESNPLPNFSDSSAQAIVSAYSTTGEDFIFEARCRVPGYDETSSKAAIISSGDAAFHHRFGFFRGIFAMNGGINNFNANFNYEIKPEYPSWDIANWHTYTLKRDNPSSGQFRRQLFIDGVFILEQITTADNTLYFDRFLSPNVGPGELQIQYIRIYNDSGVSPVLVFDADLVHSEQTDDVIVDTVSGKTQVLNYSPVDNSHWQLLEDN
jgi:hypothetical protein